MEIINIREFRQNLKNYFDKSDNEEVFLINRKNKKYLLLKIDSDINLIENKLFFNNLKKRINLFIKNIKKI